MHTDGLIIIDVQQGFMGSGTDHIPGRVEPLQDRFETVLITRFFNPEGSLHRKLIGWHRFGPGTADIELAFKPAATARIFDKSTYSALTPGIVTILQQNKVGRVFLCGIATDNCVLKTAVDVFEKGLEPVVITDATASHGGPEAHDCGLRLLERFIGAGQLRETADLAGLLKG